MEYFDIRKMPVNLWRNGAGKLVRFVASHPLPVIFTGEQALLPLPRTVSLRVFRVERVVTLLEGGEIHLESTDSFSHTLKQLQPFAFSGEQIVKAQLKEGQMSMDFNIMTRCDSCKAKVRIADRTFTTFGSRGGVVFVISGVWQLGDKVLTTDQGACWYDGKHTLRLLQSTGKLLFSEINWLPGYSPDQVQ